MHLDNKVLLNLIILLSTHCIVNEAIETATAVNITSSGITKNKSRHTREPKKQTVGRRQGEVGKTGDQQKGGGQTGGGKPGGGQTGGGETGGGQTGGGQTGNGKTGGGQSGGGQTGTQTGGQSEQTSTGKSEDEATGTEETSTEKPEELEEEEYEDSIMKNPKPKIEKDEFANNQLVKQAPNSLTYIFTITIPVFIVLVLIFCSCWYILHGPNCCFGKFNEINYREQLTESEAINIKLEELLTPI